MPGSGQSHNVVFGPTSTIHSDSEGVFDSKLVKKFLAERRMSSTQSPPHAHERNGIAERTIQTLFDTVRALLGQAAMPQSYWPIALQHAVYLRNILPTAALGGKSPFEQLTGKPLASVDHLHPFGCSVFVRVDDVLRQSLDNKGRQGVYVGYLPSKSSHRVLFLDKTAPVLVFSTHCQFDDAKMLSCPLVQCSTTA